MSQDQSGTAELATVNQLVAYHTLIQVYKIRNSGEPEYLASALKDDNRNGHIVVPITNLTLAMKSFTFREAKLWNSLLVNQNILKGWNFQE